MAMITRQILGERCSTKEAVQLLELGGVLERIPHDVDPDARLTNAAVAMRRSEWWWKVPSAHPDDYRGSVRKLHGSTGDSNTLNGEIPWR